MKWLVVIGFAVLLVLIGSTGRIPFTQLKLATSEETRARVEAENTPTYTRQQAISFVEQHIRDNCVSADKYLPNVARMEAKWIRRPWADDHHKREDHEWTVTDPLTGAFWRFYEDTGVIIAVRGDC